MILEAEVIPQKGVGLASSYQPLLRVRGLHHPPRFPRLWDAGAGVPCPHTLSRPCLLAPLSPLLVWPRGEQCGGCRRANTTDRPHAFQVILADRPCLELSADSEADMADWMQHLCQAVSKGVSDPAYTVPPASRPPAASPGPWPKPSRSGSSSWEPRWGHPGNNAGTDPRAQDTPTSSPVPTCASEVGRAF